MPDKKLNPFWRWIRGVRDDALEELKDAFDWLLPNVLRPELRQLKDYALSIVVQAEKRGGTGPEKFAWAYEQCELYLKARLKDLASPAFWINFYIQRGVGKIKFGR